MKKIVHVVPHSHWDREWYFTTSRSKIYLMNNLQKVIKLLEKNNGYDYFILDGQASLLDDYLAWKPEDKKRVKKLIAAGKLIVGPWYTQTDQMVISGESIIRNMQYGMAISNAFGNCMNIGYVPDSFGQSAAMPQIYNEFGIEDTIFWRGVSDDEVKHTEYKWRGEDGSIVNVYQIPSGYYIGGEIPEDEDKLKKFLLEEPFKTTWNRSTTDQVLFPNGFDQAPPRENLVELLDKMNNAYGDYDFVLSTYEKYIRSVKSKHPELEEIAGELLNGKLMRIHKSIFSSRSDLKKLNTQIQNYLINTLEPLLTLSYSLGFEYPVEVVKEIWKLMFENAAHDSIGSCVSDTTNEDIYFRYKKVKDLAENLVELKSREIVTRINSNQDITVTAFNTSGTEKTGIFETVLYVPQKEFSIRDTKGKIYNYSILDSVNQTDYILGQGNRLNPTKRQYHPKRVYKIKVAIDFLDVPAFGYKQFYLDLKGNSLIDLKRVSETSIENEFYKISLNENNALNILDKKNKMLYKNQAILEENGDDGDSFNYSPPRKDMMIRSTAFKPVVETVKSDLMSKISLNYEMLVPKDLRERAKKRATTSLAVTLTIRLNKASEFIDFNFTVDNRYADSHRVCVLFNTEISSKFSYADQQFGIVKRPVIREKEMQLWKQSQDKWNEMPIAIETCQSFVALEDNVHGVAVVPKGVREYEIVGEKYDTIRLTLFRTYGFMGKKDLLYRPGRASGESVVETPDAQCHKKMSFDFSAIYYQANLTEYGLAQKINDYLKELSIYQYAEYLNTRLRFTQSDVIKYLPACYSLFKIRTDAVLSLVNKAETKNGIILRFYNGKYKDNVTITVSFCKSLKIAQLVNLKDDIKSNLKIINNTLVIPNISHAKFVTLYVEFE